jgi:hypothetical protein
MRKLFGILTLMLVPVAGYAAENGLNWAYPVEPPPGTNADAARLSKQWSPRVSRCPACNATSPTVARIPNQLQFPA